MKRRGGYRRKTRRLWCKHWRQKGKISITARLAQYTEGTKVCLLAEPAVTDGLFHSKFHGLTGVVGEKRGRCYTVTIRDGGKMKSLLINPVHLKPHLKAVTDGKGKNN